MGASRSPRGLPLAHRDRLRARLAAGAQGRRRRADASAVARVATESSSRPSSTKACRGRAMSSSSLGRRAASRRRTTSPASSFWARRRPACTRMSALGSVRRGSNATPGTSRQASAARPHWGRWQDGMGITPDALRTFGETVDLIGRRLERFGKASERFGLVHGDMRLANLLMDGCTVKVIDFDDCGFSWFLYDCATTVSFFEHKPEVPELLKAWMRGYRRFGTLSPADETGDRDFRHAAPPSARRLDRLAFGDRARPVHGCRLHARHHSALRTAISRASAKPDLPLRLRPREPGVASGSVCSVKNCRRNGQQARKLTMPLA